MGHVGGIDLGASNLRAAVADRTGEPVAVERRPTPKPADGQALARAAAALLETAAGTAGIAPTQLEAVGVGTAGPIDRETGAVVRPSNLEGVTRVPLGDAIASVVGHPEVFVVNDAVAGAIGERAATADPPANLVYLTLSTGIGAGAVVDGHVLVGRGGNAAEVGHLVVDPAGRLTCGCGRRGHWEAYCGGSAVPALARLVARETGFDTALDLEDPGLDAAAVLGAAGADPLAERVAERLRAYNAIGVADVVHAFAPDVIAVAGAVALENPSLLVEPLADDVAEHAMLDVPEVRLAHHGDDAVIRGALALAARGGLEG